MFLPLAPERALALTLGLRAGCDVVARVLLAARGLPSDLPVEQFLQRIGMHVLERTPTSFVAGASGMPWLPRPELGPFAAGGPATVRFATDVRAEATAGGSLLSTETRVLATDEAGRRVFRYYWAVVGPLSGLLRRRWLKAAAEQALRA